MTDPAAAPHDVVGLQRRWGRLIHERRLDLEGNVVEWNARWHRKRRASGPPGARFDLSAEADRAVSWALAVVFLVGSALFVVAGPTAIASEVTATDWLNLIGATLFSFGSVLAVLEAADSLRRLGMTGVLGDFPSTIGGLAALVQGASALVFQLAMIASMFSTIGSIGADLVIWTPSTVGSIGFVVASVMYLEEARPANDIGTAVAGANLAGSVGFLLGSLGGYVAEPPFDVPANDFVNPVFLAGSVCFLVGSVLAVLELRRPLADHQTIETHATPMA